MKKGISVWSFGNMKLRDIFTLSKTAGFLGVEVALAEEGDINLNSTPKQLSQVKALAADCGVKLYSLATGLYWKYSLTSNDKEQREFAKDIVKKQIDAAAELGCDTILVVPGAVSVGFAPELGVVDYQTAYLRALEVLRDLAPYAERAKISIGLENVWNNFLLSPLEMSDFIDKIASPFVGSYFDAGNVLAYGHPEQWIKILGERIKKVHIKDFKRAIGTLDGFCELLSGDADFGAIISALKGVGYDGWITAEMLPPYKAHPEVLIYNTSAAMDKILS
jgi:hexulose-6-phosphate isomerase